MNQRVHPVVVDLAEADTEVVADTAVVDTAEADPVVGQGVAVPAALRHAIPQAQLEARGI